MDARSASSTAEREIVIERIFDVPATTIWQAITDPGQIRRWYMPQVQSFEAMIGHETRFTVHHNGKDFVHIWTVTEVVPNARLGYRWEYAGYPGSSLVTFELSAQGTGTRLKLVHTGLDTFEPEHHPELSLKNFLAGWTAIVAGLQTHAANMGRSIFIERIFDAPRELVWEVWTKPEHIAQWWGPNGFTTTIRKMDFRVGGVWKHTMHGPDGVDYPNSSVFREIVEHERIVFAHGGRRRDGSSANFLSTWTFEALGDKTRVTMTLLFESPDERELVIREFGAIEGGKQTFARLAEHLIQMQGTRP